MDSMPAGRPTGKELEALARALVAAAPGHGAIRGATGGLPEDVWRSLMETERDRRLPEVFATVNSLLADVPFTTAPGLIVALVALSSDLVHRLAGALDRPVNEVLTQLFAQMAADAEGLEPPASRGS